MAVSPGSALLSDTLPALLEHHATNTTTNTTTNATSSTTTHLLGSAQNNHNPTGPSASPSTTIAAAQQLQRVVVYLPELTLRYVLLAPPLAALLPALLQPYTTPLPQPSHTALVPPLLRVRYPYRDRADATACMLLEGDSAGASAGAGAGGSEEGLGGPLGVCVREVNFLFRRAAEHLLCALLLLPEHTYRALLGAPASPAHGNHFGGYGHAHSNNNSNNASNNNSSVFQSSPGSSGG
eukprot:gene46336-56738_t